MLLAHDAKNRIDRYNAYFMDGTYNKLK